MTPARFPRRGPLAALAVALVIAIAAHRRPWFSTPPAPPDSAALSRAGLVRAADGVRVFEPRLSGGFRYAPRQAVRAAGTAWPSPELKIAAATAEMRARDEDSAAAEAELGAAKLLLGNTDEAVEALEEAVARDSGHTEWMNDLAAALLVRGSDMSRGDDIVRALDLLERVSRQKPAFPEALFNRALALETAGFREPVVRAWRDYLDREPSAGWAEEGRAHVRELTSASPAQEWPRLREALLNLSRPLTETLLARAAETEAQKTRELVEEGVLGAWASAVLNTDLPTAAAWLDRAGQVAHALRAAGRDGQLADTVRALTRLSGADRSDAAEAIRSYVEGRAIERNGGYVAAVASFERCGRLLAPHSVPHAAWCQLFGALASVYKQQLDQAGTALGNLERYAKTHGFRTLLGRVHWLRAFIASAGDRLLTTKEEYERAASLFEAAGESAFLLHVRANLALTLTGLGANAEAWTQRLEILRQIDRFGEDNRRYVTLDSFGVTALQEALPFAAAHFHDAAVAAADAAALPVWQAEARTHRARVRSALGEVSAAEEDIHAADRVLERTTTDLQIRKLLGAERAAVLGELRLARDDRQAAAHLADAVADFRNLGLPVRLPLLLLQRGRALERIGDRVGAGHDFDEGIALLQAQGKGLPMGFRFTQSERSWELFAEAIRLRASSVDRGCAGLELAERARATMRPESPGHGPNPDISDLLDELPEGADVLYYSLGARESFAWVLSRSRCEAVRLQTTEGELERLVGLLLRQIQQHADAKRILNTSGELHRRIIEPLRTRPLSGECLVIVPDGALHRLPFALLRSADRFLIEERPILFATSLTGLVQASRRLSRQAATANRALIVADPATDEAESLPGARAEAADLAQLYPHRTVLTGRAATRAAIWQTIPAADVLHYAGHAVDDTFHPERSRLLLATSDDPEQGSLSVKDLFALPRQLPSLVVLAACRTRGSRVYRGQGSLGLSTPFLVKGVPSVVATLWDVDDRAGAALTAAIHKAARSGENVVTALRRAQIELLLSGEPFNPRWDWAAYVLIGGWRQSRGASS